MLCLSVFLSSYCSNLLCLLSILHSHWPMVPFHPCPTHTHTHTHTHTTHTHTPGYELINEPWAGDIYSHPNQLEPRQSVPLSLSIASCVTASVAAIFENNNNTFCSIKCFVFSYFIICLLVCLFVISFVCSLICLFVCLLNPLIN